MWKSATAAAAEEKISILDKDLVIAKVLEEITQDKTAKNF
jgi:hypothetical protein